MSTDIMKRTTFIVADAQASARFYQEVFGWTIWYDNIVLADHRFPPSGAADKAQVRLIIVEPGGTDLGKLGFLEYLDPPFDVGTPSGRSKVRMGEPILVWNTQDVESLYQRALAANADVVTAPADWTVPAAGGKGETHLRSISLFDPNGIYMEISQHM